MLCFYIVTSITRDSCDLNIWIALFTFSPAHLLNLCLSPRAIWSLGHGDRRRVRLLELQNSHRHHAPERERTHRYSLIHSDALTVEGSDITYIHTRLNLRVCFGAGLNRRRSSWTGKQGSNPGVTVPHTCNDTHLLSTPTHQQITTGMSLLDISLLNR